jgi:hypothetical protein
MLQWLTNCLTPWAIDSAVGDMKLDSQSGRQLATYARYNVLLEPGWLKTTVKLELAPEAVAKIAAMDDPNNMSDLTDIGRLAAKEQLKPEHFLALLRCEVIAAATGALTPGFRYPIRGFQSWK